MDLKSVADMSMMNLDRFFCGENDVFSEGGLLLDTSSIRLGKEALEPTVNFDWPGTGVPADKTLTIQGGPRIRLRVPREPKGLESRVDSKARWIG